MRAATSARSAQSLSSADKAVKFSTGPNLVERLEKSFALVHLARADKQPDVLPGEIFQFVGEFGQRFGDGGGGRRAFVAQKIAVAQPYDFAGAEKGQRVQGLAESGDGR